LSYSPSVLLTFPLKITLLLYEGYACGKQDKTSSTPAFHSGFSYFWWCCNCGVCNPSIEEQLFLALLKFLRFY